jgi:predicted transglutaminase-like cysteine proteinase
MRALVVCAALAVLFCAAPASAAEYHPSMRVGEYTDPPIGWVDFCKEKEHLYIECLVDDEAPKLAIFQEVWQTLLRVNQSVNEQIKPMGDLEHYGTPEKWAYPNDGYGDCEDYVLLKRKMLIAAGLPRSALLITVVKYREEGHAVLTVLTDRGEWVLDNINKAVLPWEKTSYRFYKRQAAHNPNLWVVIHDQAAPPVAAVK